jgi:hypothetical protein
LQAKLKLISVEHLSGNQLIGRLLAFLANIKLNWEGMTETNTLSLLQKFVNYGEKKFYDIGPRWQQGPRYVLQLLFSEKPQICS